VAGPLQLGGEGELTRKVILHYGTEGALEKLRRGEEKALRGGSQVRLCRKKSHQEMFGAPVKNRAMSKVPSTCRKERNDS